MSIKYRKILVCFALLLSCLLSCLMPSLHNVCYASVSVDNLSQYTNVLDDLHSDSSFDESIYPVNAGDYTLKVIQVAESNDKELFVYVYQSCSPNADLISTSINISTSIGSDLSYKNYRMQLLNNNGVFYKYKVVDLTVKDDTTRYYDISSIFRKWYENYDESLSKVNDNTITEVSFAVATRFTARTSDNGNVYYSNNSIDVIYITEKYNSFIRYSNGSSLLPAKTDSFFTAIFTDKDIEKLIGADITFITYTYQSKYDCGLIDPINGGTVTSSYGDDISHQLTLSSDKKEVIQVGYIFKSKYTWTQIESVKDFKNKTDITLSSTTIANLDKCDWVLNYWTASYKQWTDAVGVSVVANYESGTRVKDVTILRLKFETDGVVYNLGVIDNKQTGSSVVGGTSVSLLDKINSWVKSLFAFICLILLVIVLAPILPTVFTIIWNIIKFIFKAVIWVLSLPIKLFKLLFKKRE